MSERVIRVTVTAVADPSMRTAMTSFEQTAQRAHNKVRGESAKTATAEAKAAAAMEVAHAKAMATKLRLAQQARHIEERHEAAMVGVHARAESQKTAATERESKRRLDISKNVSERVRRDAERPHREPRDRPPRIGPSRDNWGRGATPNTNSAKTVMGVVGEGARGAGIDWSIQGLVSKHLATEAAARHATTSAMAGKGKVATEQDVSGTLAAVQSAGNATNRSFEEMANGLGAFTGKFADLDVGKAMLTELGTLANATGGDLSELAEFAGTVGAAMEEQLVGKTTEEKVKLLGDALRQSAYSSTKGTVEAKDLAQYGGRLAAGALKFSGSFSDALMEQNVLAQMALKGGRVDAAEATNSAKSLGTDIVKAPMLERLSEVGINPFAADGKLQSASDIIAQVYDKTKGDQAKIAELFKAENSRAAVLSFSEVYRTGGTKGIKDKFAELGGTLTPEQVEAMGALERDSKSGKARGLQNKLEWGAGRALDEAVANPELTGLLAGGGILGGGLIQSLLGGGGGGGLFGGGGGPGGGTGVNIGNANVQIASVAALVGVGAAIDQFLKTKKWNATTAGDGAEGRLNEANAVIRAVKDGDVEYLKKRQNSERLEALSAIGADPSVQPEAMIGQPMDPGAKYDAQIKQAQAMALQRETWAQPGLASLQGDMLQGLGAGGSILGGGMLDSLTASAGATAAPVVAKLDPSVAAAIQNAVTAALSRTLSVNVTNMPAGGLQPGLSASGAGTTGPSPARPNYGDQ